MGTIAHVVKTACGGVGGIAPLGLRLKIRPAKVLQKLKAKAQKGAGWAKSLPFEEKLQNGWRACHQSSTWLTA